MRCDEMHSMRTYKDLIARAGPSADYSPVQVLVHQPLISEKRGHLTCAKLIPSPPSVVL